VSRTLPYNDEPLAVAFENRIAEAAAAGRSVVTPGAVDPNPIG
jgi:hypothetical protein